MSIDHPLRRFSKFIHRRRRKLLLGIFAVVLSSVAYWAFWHQHTKRFMEVREGMFYRVAQPSEFGFRYLIEQVGIKTVVSVQLYDFRLRRGILAFGEPDGRRESDYVTRLGARAVQWPMGTEKSWPWLTPWQFEQFFQLLDDPRNWPVAVHCQGGRHRTGTLSALFRLEYDRWDVERVLAEMLSFKFGGAIRLQEHNLRTYLPRPHPTAAEWAVLQRYYSPPLYRTRAETRLSALPEDGPPGPSPARVTAWEGHPPQARAKASLLPACGITQTIADYEALIRELRAARGADLDRAIARYLDERQAFTLPLVQRLIDGPDDPLAEPAANAAADCLKKRDENTTSWSMAAALVADFGTAAQQQALLSSLGDARYQNASAERFDAVVDGVTNRYTPNRIAYLRPLLDNKAHHRRAGATQYRYSDTAVARLSAIVDENFPDVVPGRGIDAWNNGRVAALKWLAAHPAEGQLSRLKEPTGHTVVERGDPPSREDLSRARL